MADVDPSVARRLWQVLEPYHAVVYFAPEVRQALDDVGMKGFWMGYFAGRSAPLGAVGPEVVTALFFNFHPRMPARALPDAWSFASPEKVLAARLEAVDHALRRLLGDRLDGAEVAEAAAIARQAIEGGDVAGRPLFAAHTALPWPEPAHLQLWHATTLLREHRGDGHVISLAAEGLDGCSAHVAAVEAGAGGMTREVVQPSRGWSDDDWEAATARLRGIDLKDLRMRIEIRTDRLAIGPWEQVGAERAGRLAALMQPLAAAVMDAGEIPVPNPIALPWPPPPAA